jgi:hypothetical protein
MWQGKGCHVARAAWGRVLLAALATRRVLNTLVPPRAGLSSTWLASRERRGDVPGLRCYHNAPGEGAAYTCAACAGPRHTWRGGGVRGGRHSGQWLVPPPPPPPRQLSGKE